jgi:hypothetical protein
MKAGSIPSPPNIAKWSAVGTAVLFTLAMSAFAQISPSGALGSGLGGGIFDATASVILRTMKTPGSTVDVGPKRLEFTGASVNKPSLNIMTITNGTNSKIEIESLTVPSSSFRIASKLTLPLTIPAQTQALMEVEFLPTHTGDFSSSIQVRYRMVGIEKLHKMDLTLKGKGVPK